MKGYIIRGAILAAAFAVTSIFATSSVRAANYDGYWYLLSQTTKGHCGVAQWNVAISGGRLYYPGGFFMGFPVGFSGAVSPTGRLRVTVVAGDRALGSAPAGSDHIAAAAPGPARDPRERARVSGPPRG